jgi:hypothetical protein
MSKEKNMQQKLSQGDFLANPSQSQENEKEQKMIVTSGMKLLELLPKQNRNGLLEKMLKALLTSKKAWYSDRCKLIWKEKVSKSNVLLFQLQASVHGIKEKEHGLLPTPTQDSASERTKKYKQGGTPLPVAVRMIPTPQLDDGKNVNPSPKRRMTLAKYVKMFPTPTPTCENGGEQSSRVEMTKNGGFILRKKNKPENKFGAKLSDAMIYLEKMYHTPTTNDAKNLTFPESQRNRSSIIGDMMKNNKPGGKLNPNFVEFLMGYPMNWTKVEPTESNHLETQSYHKSQENLDLQSFKQNKMFRTPTAMDIGEDSFIYAAKILKGKINRNSNSRVQITLSTDVAMEYLKNNPELIDHYDKPFIVRPNLPDKLEFIDYLKSQTSISKLSKQTDIPKTKIEHWFRKDHCFSYPTIEDWNKIKPFLKDIKFDNELTYQEEQDWKHEA